MKRLLLLIIVLSTIGVSAQKIEDLPAAAALVATDLVIIDQSDATRHITVTNLFGTIPVSTTITGTTSTTDAIITNMATVTTTVLTPTSTGLIDTLETTDIATADMTVTGLWTFDNIVVDSIDADTISVDYIEVNTMFNWNPPHAHLAFHDSAETLTMTSGVWSQVTNTEHTLFIEEELVNMTFAGDSLTIDAGYGGDYVVNLGLSFAGTASDDWEICLFKNNAILGVIMEVETGGTNNTYVGLPTYLDAVVPGDDIKFMIRNTASDDDAVILACSWIIYFLHP